MAIKNTFNELNKCMSQPLTLVNLRALVLLLTRAHFSDPDNFGIFKDQLSCMCFDEDCQENPSITIKLDYIPDLKDPSPRPAIWVSFEQCAFDKKMINNLASWSEDNSYLTQTKQQAVRFALTCVADSVDIALMMAETCSDFFSGIRRHLMETLNIAYIEVDEISQPRLRDKEPEQYFEVDVMLTMMFSFVMTANIESHRLKKFALELESE